MEEIAHCRIHHRRIVLGTDIQFLTFVGGTLEQGSDVESCNYNRQKAHGSQHGVTSAHIVGNNETAVSLLNCKCLQSPALRIRNGHNAAGSLLSAVSLLYIALEYPEGNRRLCGGAGLGNDDASGVAYLSKVHQFCQIIL